MEFKLIDINTDYIIGKKYFLCKANLGELIDFVKKKFEGINFKKFNIDFQKEGQSYGESYEDNVLKFIYDTSTENNFISLYSEKVDVQNNQISLSGTFYLLDGFRRLLYDLKDKNTSKEVYVKIYDEQTQDEDTMKLLFHFNLWKFPQGVKVWLDRGWRFFLYCRLGILLENDYDKEKKVSDHFNLFRDYVYESYYRENDYLKIYNILTGKRFYDDLKFINEVLKEKEGLTESIHYSSKDRYYLEHLFNHLGREREKELEKEMKLEYLKKFIQVYKNEINRIIPMDVHGFYTQTISALMSHFIEIWKDDKKLKELMDTDISKIKIRSVLREDYIKSLGKKIIKEFNITTDSYNKRITVKDINFEYGSGKLYTTLSGVVSYTKHRIYLFFKDMYLFKRTVGKEEYVIQKTDTRPVYPGAMQKNEEEGEVFKGTLEECLTKVKEFTGKDIQINKGRTEFII